MRLIDADERVTVQSYDPMNEEYSHDEMTVADALDFATDEGCPHTIDAIPVEWIKVLTNHSDMFTRGAAKWVLGCWKKEQEAQDG